MARNDIAPVLLDLLEALVAPLETAARDVEEFPDVAPDPTTPDAFVDAPGTYYTGLVQMLQDIGFAQIVGAEVEEALERLAGAILAATAALDSLDPATAEPAEIVDAAFAVADTLQAIVTIAETIRTDLAATGSPMAEDIPRDLLTRLWHWLIWKHLARGPAPLMAFARLTGMLRLPDDTQAVSFDLSPFMALFRDPGAVFFEAFGWGSPDIDAALVLGELERVADAAGLPIDYRERDVAGATVTALHLTFLDISSFDDLGIPVTGPEAGVWIAVGTPLEPTGLTLGFWGDATPGYERVLPGGVKLSFTAEAKADGLPAVSVGPSGPSLTVPPAPGVTGGVSIGATRRSDPPMTLVPLGTMGALTAAEMGGGLTVTTEGAIAVTAIIADGLIEIRPGEPDSFLAMLLPKDGFTVPFDLAATWSDAGGFKIEGSANLDIDLPIGRTLLDALRIETLHLRIPLVPEDGPEAEISVTGGGRIGPVSATISRIGLRVSGGVSDAPGRNGIAAQRTGFALRIGDLVLDTRLKRPTGVGLSLDLGAAKGGGFLEIGEDRYAGALAIEAGTLALQAFGVLTTKRPDGSDGFSLLAFVSGQFAPIQIGFGFTLLGVGGIVGLHRDLDPDALFAAVEAGTAGDLLAPADPVGEATRLIALAESIFPQKAGQYVFGPTVRLGWGTPTLLQLDLALAATLPEPLRLVVIGRLTGALPDDRVPVVKLKIDLAGVLDLSGGSLNIRGTITDSTVQLIPIQGGFALISAWKGQSQLVFTVGGFHPAFDPPPGLPPVIRMGACLTKGSSLRLALLGYFAITPNTLQLGAMAELRVSAAGFTLLGELGFDALIEFSPFRMQIGIRARVQVKRGSRSLFQLTFKGDLSGPNAWKVSGQAIIEIPFLPDVKVSASASFGAAKEVPTAPVEVAAQVRAALADPASWRPDGPQPHLVMVGEETGLCSPSGSVRVLQTVAPLGVEWQVFYGKPAAGRRRVDPPRVTGPSGAPLDHGTRLGGKFPPGAFRTLSEKARLAAPAFETLTAGVTLDPAGLSARGPDTDKDASRQVRIFGPEPGPAMDGASLPGFSLSPHVPTGPMVTVADEPWCVAGAGGTDPAEATTWTEGQSRGAGALTLVGECP